MNSNPFQLFGVILLLICVTDGNTQSTYQMGGLPSVNMNTSLNNEWSVNTKVESRHRLQRGEFHARSETKYEHVLTDISLITAKKVGLNSRLAAGYLLRLEDGETVHRFIQQYSMVQRMAGFRLAHRFLSDQTFSETEKPEYRMRYRITTELPLDGESVDPKEFYLKINNDYLNIVQESDYDLEIRVVPLLVPSAQFPVCGCTITTQ